MLYPITPYMLYRYTYVFYSVMWFCIWPWSEQDTWYTSCSLLIQKWCLNERNFLYQRIKMAYSLAWNMSSSISESILLIVIGIARYDSYEVCNLRPMSWTAYKWYIKWYADDNCNDNTVISADKLETVEHFWHKTFYETSCMMLLMCFTLSTSYLSWFVLFPVGCCGVVLFQVVRSL